MIFKSRVAWGAQSSGTTNTSISFTAQTVAVGDFVVIGGQARGATLPTGLTIASSLGNTYAQLTHLTNNAATMTTAMWAGFVTTGGSETLSYTWTNQGCGVGTAVGFTPVRGTTGSNALDVTITTANASGVPGSVGPSSATVNPQDLVIALVAATGLTTFSAQAFSPAGTPFSVPDSLFQSSGTDNCSIEFSETLSGPAGTTQTFTWATGNNGTWVGILACFTPVVQGQWGPTVIY